MFYNLFSKYAHNFHIANLISYISFRSVIACLVAFLLSIILIPKLIAAMERRKISGQPIRIVGPQEHFAKAGTPTMGGLVVVASTIVSTLLFANLTNAHIWIVLGVFSAFAALGFWDDYVKVSRANYHGISSRTKFLLQILVTTVAFCAIEFFSKYDQATYLVFPFFKNLLIDLGVFYFPFAFVVIVGASNAVNLTDGLDGLAAGTSAIAVGSFAVISYIVGHKFYSQYLHIIHVPESGEIAIFCSALVGSLLGFLWYNAKPAEIFMGDTGSLAIGGALGIISVITKHEIALAIIGGVFVIETLSVIIQVYYYKISGGKRIFLMSPIHHHFEKKGWSEEKVVTRFWMMSLVFALIGLSSLKLR